MVIHQAIHMTIDGILSYFRKYMISHTVQQIKQEKTILKIFNRYPIDPETRECTRESGKDGASWITSHEGSRTPGNLSPPYRSTTHLLRSRKGHAPLIEKNRLAIGSYGQTPSKVEPLLFQHTTPRRRARRAINNASMAANLAPEVRVSWSTEVYWFTEIYASASWSWDLKKWVRPYYPTTK